MIIFLKYLVVHLTILRTKILTFYFTSDPELVPYIFPTIYTAFMYVRCQVTRHLRNDHRCFTTFYRGYRFTSDLDRAGLRHDYTFAINKADSGKSSNSAVMEICDG